MNERLISIPGWKIIRVIGKGSFGTVYEIEKEGEFGAGVHSALKVISIPETDAEIRAYRDEGYDDASLTKLFRSQVEDVTAEFELMSKLKGDSHIVSYEDHSIVQHEGDPGYDIFIRMELLTALPDKVRQHFPNGVIPDATVIRLGADICHALERCGQHGIIHRDIKPQNIFVNESGDFKLGDFGVSRISDHTTKATKTGTYGYMAPEVYWGKPYNASVDIYSLGIVLYWMLNERRGPFLPLPPEVPTSAQTEDALYRRMHRETIPAPKHGSEELRRIVLKACAFNPKDRYATPMEMRQDLERVLAESISLEERSTVYAGNRIGYGVKGNAPDADATIGLFERTARGGTERSTGNDTVKRRETVFCPYCGNPQQGDTRFCAFCGKPIGQAETAADLQKQTTLKEPPKEQKKNRRLGWIVALLAAIVIVAVTIVILVFTRNCGEDDGTDTMVATATPTATPDPATPVSVTPTPETVTPTPETVTPTPETVTPTPELPLYIVSGEIELRTQDGYYLTVGDEKENLTGGKGYYLKKTLDSGEAIRFRVIPYSGNTVELQALWQDGTPVFDVNGDFCYLDAYNPERYDDRGADLWNSKVGTNKRWILERGSDGTYSIYLESFPEMYLTDRTAANDSRDALSVRPRAAGSQTQEWYVMIEDAGETVVSEKAMTTTSLDSFFQKISVSPGESMWDGSDRSDAYDRYIKTKNMACMWKQCRFSYLNYYGDIVVGGQSRRNALMFYVKYQDDDDKKQARERTQVIGGVSYPGLLTGYFEIVNTERYEKMRFGLGAASVPDVYYGPARTHGKYRVTVYADSDSVLQTNWLDGTDNITCEADIDGAANVRVRLEQTYGSDYNGIDVIYTLNIVMYDVEFLKAT